MFDGMVLFLATRTHTCIITVTIHDHIHSLLTKYERSYTVIGFDKHWIVIVWLGKNCSTQDPSCIS